MAAETKLCPDCGREQDRWKPGGCCISTGNVLDEAVCLRLAYAREKAAREKAEAALEAIKQKTRPVIEEHKRNLAMLEETIALLKKDRDRASIEWSEERRLKNAALLERGAAIASRENAEARAAKLEELLRELMGKHVADRHPYPFCMTCDVPWPCSTAARIDAALPPEAGGHSPKEKG